MENLQQEIQEDMFAPSVIDDPYAYDGLGAGGEAGVSRVIDLLTTELDRTLAFLGAALSPTSLPSWCAGAR